MAGDVEANFSPRTFRYLPLSAVPEPAHVHFASQSHGRAPPLGSLWGLRLALSGRLNGTAKVHGAETKPAGEDHDARATSGV